MNETNETTVVNIHTHEGTSVYIGRGSNFGNPFVIGKDGDRDEVIEKYRAFFASRLNSPEFRQALEKLRGKALGCYCVPKACHGGIIKAYLDGEL